MALTPTLWHLPATLGSHMSAAVTVSLLGNMRQRTRPREAGGSWREHPENSWSSVHKSGKELDPVSSGGWAGTDLQSYSMVPGISPKSYRECLVAFKQGMTCANVDYGTLTLSKSGQNLCICWPPHYTQDSTHKSYPRDGHVNKEPLSSGQEGQKHLASLGTRSWQDTRKRKRQVDGKDAEVHQARENGRIGIWRLQLPHCWFAHCLRNTDFPNQAANAFARGATFIPPSWSFTFKASGYFPMVVLPFLGLTSMHWADSQLPERNAFLPCGRKDPFPRS